jgi:arylsulfatase A-like enzyme
MRLFAIAICAALSLGLHPGRLSAGETPLPNILFLLADDQRYDDLGCMGNPVIQTPHLDRLAAENVLFKNAFVTTAICCVSRASILTGQHQRRHGIEGFATALSSEAMDMTYPVLLRNLAGLAEYGSVLANMRNRWKRLGTM